MKGSRYFLHGTCEIFGCKQFVSLGLELVGHIVIRLIRFPTSSFTIRIVFART